MPLYFLEWTKSNDHGLIFKNKQCIKYTINNNPFQGSLSKVNLGRETNIYEHDSHSLTHQPATKTQQPLAHPCPSPPAGWGGEWKTGETHGLRYRQSNKTTKEILIRIAMILKIIIRIIIIINMQNKLYTIKFSHYLMTILQPVPEQRAQNSETENFA